MAINQPFLDQFCIFWYKWTPTDTLLSNVLLNVITQPLSGIMALAQPFLDRLWIFLLQMNIKGSPFVPCASQWNHATYQGENGPESAISWPILDLFGTNEHQRITFCYMCFSMESRNLSGGKWPFLDTDFGYFWYKWIPKDSLLSHVFLNGITQPLRVKWP